MSNFGNNWEELSTYIFWSIKMKKATIKELESRLNKLQYSCMNSGIIFVKKDTIM